MNVINLLEGQLKINDAYFQKYPINDIDTGIEFDDIIHFGTVEPRF